MNSQWFWKYGYLLVVPVALVFFWLNGSADRTNQDNVNPEVFVAFNKIETDCNAENFDAQSKNCSKIYKFKKECKQVTRKCNSFTYFQFLEELKYELPPYYTKHYIPDE